MMKAGQLCCLSFVAALVVSTTTGVDARERSVPDVTTISSVPGKYAKIKQGPTAWACTTMDGEQPWLAYDEIFAFISGANDEERDYSQEFTALYPLQEIYKSDGSLSGVLCICLPKGDTCYPPRPLPDSKVAIAKRLDPIVYYTHRFWGRASPAMIRYEREKMAGYLDEDGQSYEGSHYLVSYMPDMLRDIRYDIEELETGISSRRL